MCGDSVCVRGQRVCAGTACVCGDSVCWNSVCVCVGTACVWGQRVCGDSVCVRGQRVWEQLWTFQLREGP